VRQSAWIYGSTAFNGSTPRIFQTLRTGSLSNPSNGRVGPDVTAPPNAYTTVGPGVGASPYATNGVAPAMPIAPQWADFPYLADRWASQGFTEVVLSGAACGYNWS